MTCEEKQQNANERNQKGDVAADEKDKPGRERQEADLGAQGSPGASSEPPASAPTAPRAAFSPQLRDRQEHGGLQPSPTFYQVPQFP